MELLIEQFDVDKSTIENQLKEAIGKADDGELFTEYCEPPQE